MIVTELIEPGEEFPVSYGKDKTVSVKALSLREKRQVTKLCMLVTNSETDVDDRLNSIEQAIAICCPSAESLMDSLDEELAMQIVSKTIQKLSVDKETAKKSESQP